ncbi:uncharacterized protein [Procambarus clarkii]|uniref:uncharacterized protein n=1 Tax=Procambarus clarkii TaxID=6728 RepID=UPI001E674215|nr:uncharacterized protein LOC123746446 [Procambarus clarkii]
MMALLVLHLTATSISLLLVLLVVPANQSNQNLLLQEITYIQNQQQMNSKNSENTTNSYKTNILNNETLSSVKENPSNTATSTRLAHVNFTDNNHQYKEKDYTENFPDQYGSDLKDSYEDKNTENELLLSPSGFMNLCDHPPTKFSSEFLTHSEEVCVGQETQYMKVDSTLTLCNYIYASIYKRYPLYTLKTIGNYTGLKCFIDEDFIAMCLPFFQRFNHCEKKKLMTLCLNEGVIFFQFSVCQQPSVMDKFFIPLLVDSLIENDEFCFNHICDGTFRVVDSKVNGIPFRLIKLNLGLPERGKNCDYLFDSFSNWKHYNETIYVDANIYFPCCYSMYTILWVGKPEEHGLNSFWDFLPQSCHVCEFLLISAALCIGISGVLGNMIVVVVMFCGRHRWEESSMVRTSLALADLFICIFVAIPSVAYQISLITGDITSTEYSWEEHSYYNYSELPDINHYVLQVVDGGYRLFQSFVLSCCSIVSLISILLLSMERFIITSRSLQYNAYFSVFRVKIVIILTWVMSFLDTLQFIYDGNGHFRAMWSTITKLPVGLSEKVSDITHWSLYLRLIFLCLTCVSTFIFSSLAIINFIHEQKRIRAEWMCLNMRVWGTLERENKRIMVTMILIMLLFSLSVLPLGINIFFNIIDYDFYWFNLFNYISWWLFLAGSAWNPWIYNMRSSQFKSDMIRTFRSITKFSKKKR